MRFRRFAPLAATAMVATGLGLAQPAHATVRHLAFGHIVIQSNTLGLATFTVTDHYLLNFDCALELRPPGDNRIVVLCTPKATIPSDWVFFCTHWITTATATDGPSGGPGEVRGTAECKDAGGNGTTNLVRSDVPPSTDVKHGFPDNTVDVWAVRCYATGTGIGGAPTPGYYVDCYEPDIRLIEIR